jgi:hypothetical protein
LELSKAILVEMCNAHPNGRHKDLLLAYFKTVECLVGLSDRDPSPFYRQLFATEASHQPYLNLARCLPHPMTVDFCRGDMHRVLVYVDMLRLGAVNQRDPRAPST